MNTLKKIIKNYDKKFLCFTLMVGLVLPLFVCSPIMAFILYITGDHPDIYISTLLGYLLLAGILGVIVFSLILWSVATYLMAIYNYAKLSISKWEVKDKTSKGSFSTADEYLQYIENKLMYRKLDEENGIMRKYVKISKEDAQQVVDVIMNICGDMVCRSSLPEEIYDRG